MVPGADHEEPAPSREAMASLAADLLELGRRAGLDAIGVARADPFLGTRRVLEERRNAGLHAGMHFTYGNPVRSTDPGQALPGARSLLVGARSYRRAEPGHEAGIGRRADPGRAVGMPTKEPVPVAIPARAGTPRGRVARYSWQDHYQPLRDALGSLAGHLQDAGWRARVLVDDNSLVDREAAYRAGLGWYGKNTLLLLPRLGSWYVLGSVVTDAPLPASAERVGDGCRSCARCLAACPTGALVAPGVLDARRCLAWLLEAPGWFPPEQREALGGRIYGCDECQEACPANRAAERRRPPPPAGADDEAWVDLAWLLAQDDATLLEHFGRWYIPRRQARYLRRNALVALGNIAEGSEPEVEAALRACLSHPDPLVRGHAVWAAARLGRQDLLARMGGEGDPGVLAELARVTAGAIRPPAASAWAQGAARDATPGPRPT